MQLQSHIEALKAAWAAAVPTISLYYHLAPEKTVAPYAVLRIGSVSVGETTNSTKDWETTAQLVIFTTTDTAATAAVDTAVSVFERTPIAGFYSNSITNCDLDFSYGDQGELWSASLAILLRWTV